MDRKREAFEKWANSLPYLADKNWKMEKEIAWRAYQQAYEDMYPVFDRIHKIVRRGGSLYEPVFGMDSAADELWEIIDANNDVIARGKTFRELCVNFMLADGRDGEG